MWQIIEQHGDFHCLYFGLDLVFLKTWVLGSDQIAVGIYLFNVKFSYFILVFPLLTLNKQM